MALVLSECLHICMSLWATVGVKGLTGDVMCLLTGTTLAQSRDRRDEVDDDDWDSDDSLPL